MLFRVVVACGVPPIQIRIIECANKPRDCRLQPALFNRERGFPQFDLVSLRKKQIEQSQVHTALTGQGEQFGGASPPSPIGAMIEGDQV